jgi:hypothetical protein
VRSQEVANPVSTIGPKTPLNGVTAIPGSTLNFDLALAISHLRSLGALVHALRRGRPLCSATQGAAVPSPRSVDPEG